MIRSAISPRFATSTRSKGRLELSLRKDAIRPHRARLLLRAPPSSLRQFVLYSKRDVAMLFSRVRVALVGQHVEGPDDARTRLGRKDDVVHVAARSGDIGIGELGLVFGDQSLPFRL